MKKIIGAAVTASMALFVNNTMAEIRNITDGARVEEVRPDTPIYTRARDNYRYQSSYNVESVEDEALSNVDLIVEPVAASAEVIDVTNSVNVGDVLTQTIQTTPSVPAVEEITTTTTIVPSQDTLTNKASHITKDGNLSLEKLEKMFNLIDNNSDGAITKGEFIDFHDKVMRKKAERAEVNQQPQVAPIFNKPMGRVDLP